MAEDEYEKRYMAPDERVLFREKVVSRAAFGVSLAMAVIFGLFGLGLVAMAAAAGKADIVGLGAFAVAFAAMMGGLGVLFSVFRVMVTSAHLHVHFGWSKKKIPYSEILEARSVEIKGMRQGKVSIGFDGIVRTWVGTASSGRGVEITYQPPGKRKHILTIGSENPEQFLAALERSRLAEAKTRVSVDDAKLSAERGEGDAEPAERVGERGRKQGA